VEEGEEVAGVADDFVDVALDFEGVEVEHGLDCVHVFG
jgi:hypothetical protein